MHVLEIEDRPSEVWKNGGGTTRTLAFDTTQVPSAWRISVAEITQSGDFSRFENTERLSILLRGPGLQLRCAGVTHVFERLGSLLRYSGADFTTAALGPQPARFLNVMVTKDQAKAQAYVSPVDLEVLPQSLVLVTVVQGAVLLRTEEEVPHPMRQGQYVLLDSGTPKVAMQVALQATAPDALWVAVVLSYS